MAVLEFLNGNQIGQRLPIEGERAILGRHPDCDIVLDQGAVSRQHAQISLVDGRYILEDLRSRNGTLLNGQLISSPQPLSNGDEVKICDLTLTFHLDGSDAPAALQLPSSDETYDGLFTVEEGDDGKVGSSTVMMKLDIRASGEGVRLTANPETKLRAMIEITQNLAQATAIDQILPKILDSLFNIFVQADRGFVVLSTADNKLLPKAFKQRRKNDEESARISRTIVNEAIKQKQAILSADAATDARFEMSQSIADFRIRSMMCAPMVSAEGAVLGVIQIDTLDQRGRFTSEDLEVLAGVASQAAFALDNAQLHERRLQQQKIEQDLATAHKVQQALLPSAPPKIEGYQFFDFYEPANQIGGDFYDYIPLPGGRIAIVLADVSGKGIPAALVMAKLSADVRYCLASESSAAKAVDRINEHFCGSGWEDRFMTFVLALLDPREHRVTLVNAGHMPPFARFGAGRVEAAAAEIAGLPLGVADGVSYESADVPLAPGEVITLFTDGISEALNPANDLYTLERLQQQVGLVADNAAALGRIILDDVKRHAAGRAQSDDMCLVVFGRNP
ncbi:MAG: SpoIIE family protein phosphatase [Pirellulales bacterium]|nr:SpoIIE family protein phosphatase [Pirellulales bacterium]